MAYIKDNNSKVTLGTNPQLASMIFKTDGPLDDRTALSTRASLISKTALGARKTDNTLEVDANIKNWVYPAMTCAIQETGEIYVLTNKALLTLYSDSDIAAMSDTTIEAEINKAWTKLALSSDLNSIISVASGVFQFKGIAEAVSPDLSYIVTCLGAEGDALSPIGTAIDLEGDVYYGWLIGSKQIWTDSLVLNRSSTQYTRGEGEVVKCIVYNDIYYFTTEQVTDDKTILESISGHQIKVYTTDLLTTGSASVHINVYDGEIIGDGYIIEYTAYTFTPIDNFATVDVLHAHTIIYASDGTKVVDDTTIPDNSGHVYQIGENEYASNGQIWVKLGSPVEDWIIL